MEEHCIKSECDESNVCQTSLWCNLDVKIGGKSVFDKELSDLGLNKVEHLYKDNGTLYDWPSFKHDKNLTDRQVMKWNSIVSAVPKDWLKLSGSMILSCQERIHNVHYADVSGLHKELSVAVSKDIYSSFIGKKSITTSAVAYFRTEFGVEKQEYLESYNRTFVTTIENKLRSFQLRLLHNIVFTNARLYKMQIVDTELCSLCKHERETVSHLFTECKHAQDLWEKIVETWMTQIGIHTLSRKEIMLGISMDTENERVINHLILLAKSYIYNCRVMNKVISFVEFKIYLNHIRYIEKCNAESKGKERIHNSKWELLDM